MPQIKNCPARSQPLLKRQEHLGSVKEWMQEQAKIHSGLQLRWLLAHADDGVVWGELRDGALVTSDSVTDASPLLRAVTLQQARLFSAQGELLLWRDGDNLWNARLLYDASPGESQWREAFDEAQMLWGTQGELLDGFTLWREGAQGLRHAVPSSSNGSSEPPRLWVRHYLANEDFARVEISRLLFLGEKP